MKYTFNALVGFNIGYPQVFFEGEGTDTGGGEITAPWSGADGMWHIGEGEAAKPWYSTLPDEVARNHVEAKGYATPAELALANYNLTRLQSGDPNVIALPATDATPEQMSEFYGKLGRPQEASGYEFQFGENIKVDDKVLEFGRAAFHEAGLTPKQAQIVADKWNAFAAETTTNGMEEAQKKNAQEMTALEGKWGADLDKNREAGRRAVKALGVDDALIAKVEGAIGTAAIVELMAVIGRKSDEGGLVLNDGKNNDPNDPSSMTKEQAQARISELMGDAEFQKKYTDAKHPEYKASVDIMAALFAKAG